MQTNITAQVIADSVSTQGVRMTTLEIEYPRFILAELNTHRMLSKNSASSRAIPVKTMHEHILQNPAVPVYWGVNQPGMQAKQELDETTKDQAYQVWQQAMEYAVYKAKILSDELKVHKQIANRITEPWMQMKTVISGTEWANFFWLRAHADAQPEIRTLAEQMQQAIDNSTPQLLKSGEWHVPYVTTERDPTTNSLVYFDSAGNVINSAQARVVSASCCAQVSYRKNDASYEKALKIYNQLIESEPCHASPVEHQATPMHLPSISAYDPETWHDGVTHVSANGDLWSGNLRGWIQHRKLIPGESCW